MYFIMAHRVSYYCAVGATPKSCRSISSPGENFASIFTKNNSFKIGFKRDFLKKKIISPLQDVGTATY